MWSHVRVRIPRLGDLKASGSLHAESRKTLPKAHEVLVRGKRISVLATGPSKNARLFLYCMLLLSIKKKFYVLLKIYILAVILFVTWSFIVFSAQHCLLHLHSRGSRKMIPKLYPLESAPRICLKILLSSQLGRGFATGI